MQCGVCGEEVTLDDLAVMAAPEVKVFHRGEGCPACFDDSDEGDEVSEEDTWACKSCDVKIVTDDEANLYWQGGSLVHPYGSLKYAWGRHPEAKNPIEENLDLDECPGCQDTDDELDQADESDFEEHDLELDEDDEEEVDFDDLDDEEAST